MKNQYIGSLYALAGSNRERNPEAGYEEQLRDFLFPHTGMSSPTNLEALRLNFFSPPEIVLFILNIYLVDVILQWRILESVTTPVTLALMIF